MTPDLDAEGTVIFVDELRRLCAAKRGGPNIGEPGYSVSADKRYEAEYQRTRTRIIEAVPALLDYLERIDAEATDLRRRLEEAEQMRETLAYYANPNNWVRDWKGNANIWMGDTEDGYEFAQAILASLDTAAASDEREQR